MFMLGDNKFNATSGSQGAAFSDIIVPGLILQILNNFPISVTVFSGLYVVVGIWQDLFETGKYHARVLNQQV